MWISVVPGDDPGEWVLLPPRLRQGVAAGTVPLRFGVRQVPVEVRLARAVGQGANGRSVQSPARVKVARSVLAELRIRTEPVYQLRRFSDCLEIGPVLGLLLGNRNHWYDNTWLSREAERVSGVYPRTGGLFCAFSPRNISFIDGCAYGLFYVPDEGRWRFGEVPLPAVAHRRSFHNDPEAVRQLRCNAGVHVFNSRRFDKWELYQMLCRDPDFRPHLPETVQVGDGAEVPVLLRRHGSVVLKPAHLSRGRGILMLNGQEQPYRLLDCRPGACEGESLLSLSELAGLLSREVLGHHYLCQQRVDLARVEGAPFDVRVVMQRSPRGRWRCNGIECRVARPGALLTSIAQGGKALPLAVAVSLAFGPALPPVTAENRVLGLAQQLCHRFDQTRETFGELGIDIALDTAGKAWLIEANVLPTFKGFLAMEPETYRRLLAAPLLYANALAGFGEEDLGDLLQD